MCKTISLTQLLNLKFHLIQFGCGLTDGLVEDTILFLHVFESSFSTNLAPLTQGRHRLAQVFVLLLQTLQLKTMIKKRVTSLSTWACDSWIKVCGWRLTCLSEFSLSVSRVFSSKAFSFIRSVLSDSAVQSCSLSDTSSRSNFSSWKWLHHHLTSIHPNLGRRGLYHLTCYLKWKSKLSSWHY